MHKTSMYFVSYICIQATQSSFIYSVHRHLSVKHQYTEVENKNSEASILGSNLSSASSELCDFKSGTECLWTGVL